MRVLVSGIAFAGLAPLLLLACAGSAPRDPGPPEAAAVAAAPAAPAEPTLPPVPAGAVTRSYECVDGYRFVARFAGSEAWVLRPEGPAHLGGEPVASGARYSDGTLTLWTKGDEALLEGLGAIHRGCRYDPAQAVEPNKL